MVVRDLYTTKDVTEVRQALLKEQDGTCAITMLDIPPKQAVLDHQHDSEQLVRGVLHRQANSWLGKAENAYTRMLAHWYPGTLSQFMRQCANYLEKEQEARFRHTGWLGKISTKFNALKEPDKDRVLEMLGQPKGSNSKERKALFRKVVLDRNVGFEKIKETLERVRV